MSAWIFKMLLKVLKPFAGIMIFAALLSYLEGALGENDEGTDDDTDGEPASPIE